MIVDSENPSEKANLHLDKGLGRMIFYLKLMTTGAMLFAAFRLTFREKGKAEIQKASYLTVIVDACIGMRVSIPVLHTLRWNTPSS